MNQRSFTQAERQAHVEAWRSLAETAQTYCNRHGIKSSTFRGWVCYYGGCRRPRRNNLTQNQLPVPSLTFVQAKLQSPEYRPLRSTTAATLEHPSGCRLQFIDLPPVEWMTSLMKGL